MANKFLDALASRNEGSPPIWLMRQAGRYLPEYRAIRAKHSLRELFFTPKLAAQVTLQPIERFGFDAAILFADITSIAPAMGFGLEFAEGPVPTPYATESNWQSLPIDLSLLDPLGEAARLAKQRLDVPLIGFCGAPFTIATYLAKDWKTWAPENFTAFLDHICQMCIHSLRVQIGGGASAVQIFDSWANTLVGDQFEKYSLNYIQKIIDGVDCPTIVFMRGGSLRAEEIAALKPGAISVDWERPIQEIRKTVKLPLQGNLDPDLLFKPLNQIEREVRLLLENMHSDPAFILNLGHGIKPQTPIEAVHTLINTVRN